METNPLPWDAIGMLLVLLGIVLAQWVEDSRSRRRRAAPPAIRFSALVGLSPSRRRVNVQGSNAKGG